MDRSGRSDKNIRNNRGSHLTGLEDGPNDVVCRKDGSHAPALEARYVNHQDSDGVSEQTPTFVAESANILLPVVK